MDNGYEMGIISAVIQHTCLEDLFSNELTAEIICKAAVDAGVPADELVKALARLYGG